MQLGSVVLALLALATIVAIPVVVRRRRRAGPPAYGSDTAGLLWLFLLFVALVLCLVPRGRRSW